MAGRKLKKVEMRRDPFREFLARTFTTTENSLEHHWQVYLAGFLIIVGAVAGIYYYIDHLQQKKDTSSALLSEIMDTADAPVLPAGDPQRADYLKNGMKVFGTTEERSSELKKKIDELGAKGSSDFQEKAASYLRASDLARTGSYPESLKLLEALERDNSFAALSLSLQARIHEAMGDQAKAESIFTRLSTLKNATLPAPMGLTLLAEFYERQGKKSEALKAYEDALKVISEAKALTPDKKDQASAQTQQRDSMETRLKDKVKELKA